MDSKMSLNPVMAYPAPSAPVIVQGVVVGTQPNNHTVPSLVPNESGIRDYLFQNNWPIGLQDTFVKNLDKIAFRFFICDDSGSMSSSDGHRLVSDNGGSKRSLACSFVHVSRHKF